MNNTYRLSILAAALLVVALASCSHTTDSAMNPADVLANEPKVGSTFTYTKVQFDTTDTPILTDTLTTRIDSLLRISPVDREFRIVSFSNFFERNFTSFMRFTQDSDMQFLTSGGWATYPVRTHQTFATSANYTDNHGKACVNHVSYAWLGVENQILNGKAIPCSVIEYSYASGPIPDTTSLIQITRYWYSSEYGYLIHEKMTRNDYYGTPLGGLYETSLVDYKEE